MNISLQQKIFQKNVTEFLDKNTKIMEFWQLSNIIILGISQDNKRGNLKTIKDDIFCIKRTICMFEFVL